MSGWELRLDNELISVYNFFEEIGILFEENFFSYIFFYLRNFCLILFNIVCVVIFYELKYYF